MSMTSVTEDEICVWLSFEQVMLNCFCVGGMSCNWEVLCGGMTCGCDIIDGITCDNVSRHF